MQKIENIINQIPQDFKYTKVIDSPCYINTIVDSTNNPYGVLNYYTEPDETYKWHYKLNQVKLSNHRDKVISMVYNNGINSVEETLDSEELVSNYSIDDNNTINITQSASYVYNSSYESTHFMIGVNLSGGLSPVIHDNEHLVAVTVSATYTLNNTTVTKVLTPYEDMLLESNQKSNISYQIVPYRNGFIIKFYGNTIYPSGHTLSFDYINSMKRDIEFNITYNIQANDDYDPETDVISKYIYYPTVNKDEPDTLLILANKLSREEFEHATKEDIKLNNNLRVRVAHIQPDDSEAYNVVLGYVYSDFIFTQQVRTDNYEILENLIHEDAL